MVPVQAPTQGHFMVIQIDRNHNNIVQWDSNFQPKDKPSSRKRSNALCHIQESNPNKTRIGTPMAYYFKFPCPKEVSDKQLPLVYFGLQYSLIYVIYSRQYFRYV